MSRASLSPPLTFTYVGARARLRIPISASRVPGYDSVPPDQKYSGSGFRVTFCILKVSPCRLSGVSRRGAQDRADLLAYARVTGALAPDLGHRRHPHPQDEMLWSIGKWETL